MGKFITGWLLDTVSALGYSLAHPHGATAPLSPPSSLQPPFNALTRFVLRQHAQMPDYFRPLLTAATLGFDLFGVLKAGRPFHGLSPELRDKQLLAWKNSKFSFQRDLVRYYESLGTLALFGREFAQ